MFSEPGQSRRQKEEQAWIFFVDILDECEGAWRAASCIWGYTFLIMQVL